MLDEERGERTRIVQSLQGTIERVRASGLEEERLKRELASLSVDIAAERQKREECKRALGATTEQLQEARARLLEVQKSLDEAQAARAAEAREAKARLQKVMFHQERVTACCHSLLLMCNNHLLSSTRRKQMQL
jgi:chromosome segregation ATPase